MKMGFEIGDGKRAGFDGVRRKIEVNGQQLKQTRNVNQPWVDPNTSQQRADGLMPWKSYVDMGVNSYVQGVNNVVQGVAGWLHLLWQPWLGPIGGGYGGYGGSLPSTTEGDNAAVDGGGGGTGLGLGLRKRSPPHQRRHHKRTLLNVALGTQEYTDAHPNPNSGDKKEEEQKDCDVTIMGSPQVEQMFPSNGPEPLKVWIVGMEFFQQNLVYHNLDTAQTVILPRT